MPITQKLQQLTNILSKLKRQVQQLKTSQTNFNWLKEKKSIIQEALQDKITSCQRGIHEYTKVLIMPDQAKINQIKLNQCQELLNFLPII